MLNVSRLGIASLYATNGQSVLATDIKRFDIEHLARRSIETTDTCNSYSLLAYVCTIRIVTDVIMRTFYKCLIFRYNNRQRMLFLTVISQVFDFLHRCSGNVCQIINKTAAYNHILSEICQHMRALYNA